LSEQTKLLEVFFVFVVAKDRLADPQRAVVELTFSCLTDLSVVIQPDLELVTGLLVEAVP